MSFKAPDPGEMRLDKPYSEETAQMIDEEVRKLVKQAEEKTYETLTKYKAEVEKVVKVHLYFNNLMLCSLLCV